ncbi:hypothetical protein BV454_01156 [Bacillus altitudinis]|nr:hypothetical protein [Bacillus altitudinis]CAI7726742.1 hypothetical protein WT0BACILLUS_03278 [Bacillus altitudinis]CVN30511.1 Uncharacterised protein [Streptococcus pneumoniae]SIT66128.1 hypothetical protein SAMN05216491_0054 [Bacillus altitudinis]
MRHESIEANHDIPEMFAQCGSKRTRHSAVGEG